MNKSPKTLTPKEANYAFRRITYNIMITVTSLRVLRNLDRPECGRMPAHHKEVVKVAALLMIRNFDDFLFTNTDSATKKRRKGKFKDDVFACDFDLPNWPPQDTSLRLTTKDDGTGERGRINKLVGHVVSVAPKVLKNTEAIRIIETHLKLAVQFVNDTLYRKLVSLTGNSKKYIEQSNIYLKDLGMPEIKAPPSLHLEH